MTKKALNKMFHDADGNLFGWIIAMEEKNSLTVWWSGYTDEDFEIAADYVQHLKRPDRFLVINPKTSKAYPFPVILYHMNAKKEGAHR